MILRSLLFVPGDSEKKLAKAESAGADALIVDLEDSVAPDHKARARALVSDFLRSRPTDTRRERIWVRINPLESQMALSDLVAVVGGRPDGIMLPKAQGPADVEKLGHYLDALEAQAQLPVGSVRIVPVATETAAAPFRLGDYQAASLPRLAALTWGAEDLSAALGASTNKDEQGGWAFTYRMVRSLTLMAAHAAGVDAIETLHADYRDDEGLLRSCQAARAEGFSGRMAIHPAQVPIINQGFMPSSAEVARAERVVAAFAAAGGDGTIGLEGQMLDRPHLLQAQRLLGLGSGR